MRRNHFGNDHELPRSPNTELPSDALLKAPPPWQNAKPTVSTRFLPEVGFRLRPHRSLAPYEV
jgi:hypothetical protein